MILRSLVLQHFRNYTLKRFDFSDMLTVIIGPNTAGKTNMSEAIHLLSSGKSFRSSSDTDMIAFGQEIARVKGLLIRGDEKTTTEIVVASPQATGGRFSKKFLINGIGKSRSALRGLLPLVLFRPEELDIIIDGPSLRRDFLDEVLEQADKLYLQAKTIYDQSLRQRNALLRIAQETGRRNVQEFAYWDNLLIGNGQIITKKREEFLQFINQSKQDIFPLQTIYDKSVISFERLNQYKEAEVGAGVTLVGPHRDDFSITIKFGKENKDIRHFGSRGQSRLAVLQLKMLQIQYLLQSLGTQPLLILDDIFSELDSSHIQLVLEKIQGSQIILTTTHKEFIPRKLTSHASVVELNDHERSI